MTNIPIVTACGLTETQRGPAIVVINQAANLGRGQTILSSGQMESFGIQVGTLQHILEGYKVANEIAQHGAGASAFSDWWAYKFEVIDAIPYAAAIMHDRTRYVEGRDGDGAERVAVPIHRDDRPIALAARVESDLQHRAPDAGRAVDGDASDEEVVDLLRQGGDDAGRGIERVQAVRREVHRREMRVLAEFVEPLWVG